MISLLLEVSFWSALALIIYSYTVYPLIIWGLSSWKNRKSTNENRNSEKQSETKYFPSVSVVIAAYREEAVILERLNNLTQIDYPRDKIEFLIGCDGNEDLTGELVRSYKADQVRLFQFEERRGKSSVLNDCVPEAKGEIIVFSDANTKMDPQCIKELIKHFQDETVGCVCGQLILEDPKTGQNIDGIYWKYENFLKKCESTLGANLGVNGALYALRKSLYRPLPPKTINDDFLIGMRVHLMGQRIVYDDSAFASEETASSVQDEFKRRTRIGTGAFQSLFFLKKLLHPKHGYIAFAFWSHKVLRWICPQLMAVVFLANLCLLSNPIYQFTFIVQGLFYLAAFLGTKFVTENRYLKLCLIPGMFVQMNLALANGFYRWLAIKQDGTWDRTERKDIPDLPTTEHELTDSPLSSNESEASLSKIN